MPSFPNEIIEWFIFPFARLELRNGIPQKKLGRIQHVDSFVQAQIFPNIVTLPYHPNFIVLLCQPKTKPFLLICYLDKSS
jgi:hypothetical protein